MSKNSFKNTRLFALVDCNNFFASCERLFRPELNGKPVVVLSNNDGCVIARSNEAKALGIPMGAPAFKFKDIFEKQNVNIFSTNFTLYGDISNRIMNLLGQLAPELEIYSVDEAFMIFDDISFDIEEYCREVSVKVYKEVGIPISIGIGKTKTLAKLANKVAKDNPEKYKSVFNFEGATKPDEVIKDIPVEKVWGIGRKNRVKLNELGIYTVLDLKRADRAAIKRYLNVSAERTMLELNGTSCIEIEEAEIKKTILTSRTFAKSTDNFSVLEEALSSFASRATEKLRKDRCCCMYVTVYISTNRHRQDESQYSSFWTETSEVPICYTADIIKLGLEALKKVFKKGYVYKRLGVVLSGIVPDNGEILGLFETEEAEKIKKQKLGKLLDSINRIQGRDFIRIASGGRGDAWKRGQHMVSKKYTTDWSDLLEVG